MESGGWKGIKRREEIGPVNEGWDLGDGMQLERRPFSPVAGENSVALSVGPGD